MKITIHIDGGARGNPGSAGAGIVLRGVDDAPLLEAGYYLGHQTNNVAEYTALLKALEAAKQAGATELSIFSDSELLVRQINGEYRVKNPALKDLFDDAFGRLRSFAKWEVRHVRREQNARADELANLAMDACEDVVEVDHR
jgi:ribonuclease HI